MSDAGYDVVRRRLELALGQVAHGGNAVERLRNGVEIFPAMEEAILGATRWVDLLTFVYWTGEPAERIGRALVDRARAGVRVRVIIDAFGGRHMSRELVTRLEDAGVVFHWFRAPADDETDPLDANHRTHRKLLVVDRRDAFVGGVGIAEEWDGDAQGPGQWRDSHFRLRGRVVDALAGAFLDDWAGSGSPLFAPDEDLTPAGSAGDVDMLVVRSESERGLNDHAMARRVLLTSARERIHLTTAYFSPSEEMVDWLVAAAGRGVEVVVLMPGEHTDKRIPQVSGEACYPALLEAGVQVWRYERTMLHAKVLTVDGRYAVIGSANFNLRSMRQDEELDVVVFCEELTAQLDADFAEDLEHASRVTAEDWQDERGVLQRVQEAAVGLIDRWV